MPVNLIEVKAGVGAFIVVPENIERGFLTVQELTGKRLTSKLAGMRTLPMETVERGETHEMALRRMLFESADTGKSGEEIGLSFVKDKDHLTKQKLARCELSLGVVLHAYLIETTPDVVTRPGSWTHEVGEVEWTTLDDILLQPTGTLRFRPGVYETTLGYLQYLESLREGRCFSPSMYRYSELKNQVPSTVFDLMESGAIGTEVQSLLVQSPQPLRVLEELTHSLSRL